MFNDRIDSIIAVQLHFLMDSFHRASHIAHIPEGDNERYQEHAGNHNGYIGIVWAMTRYAEAVEACMREYEDAGHDFPGVFEYDVTEELGKWLFRHPDWFTDVPSAQFDIHMRNTIRDWFESGITPAASAAQPETSTMKLSTLIAQLRSTEALHGDLDVLTRGSEPQKMVDALEVRVVKTAKRTAVFIGKPTATND